jgi:hypothetical protein
MPTPELLNRISNGQQPRRAVHVKIPYVSLVLPTALFVMASLWLIIGSALGGTEHGAFLPSLISTGVFFALQVGLKTFRFNNTNWLSVKNCALYFFYIHQVIVPITVSLFGQKAIVISTLYNASAEALAVTIYRNLLGMCVFAITLSLYEYYQREMVTHVDLGKRVPLLFGLGMLIFGLITVTIQFGSPSGMIEFYLDPANERDFMPESAPVWVVMNLFRGFAATGLIIVWCAMLDSRNYRRLACWCTPLVALAVLLLNFQANRASMAFPLLGMGAVFSQRAWRIPALAVIFALVMLFPVMLFLASFRGSKFLLTEALQDTGIRRVVIEDLAVVPNLQTYFQAPQGETLLVEQVTERLWGTSLVSSIMAPVPLLGKSFRNYSGTEIYNRAIYGDLPANDQVIPYTGEWYINFGMLGVVVGYMLLALLVSYFDKQFHFYVNGGAMQLYAFAVFGLWGAYGVIVSVAVVSQLYIYLGFPIYIAMAYAHFSGRRKVFGRDGRL